MIQKYVRNPTIVEAVHFTKDTPYETLETFITADKEIFCLPHSRTPLTVVVNTFEGDMEAKWGDYILKNNHGEIYPISKESFERNYKLIDKNLGK